MPMAIGSEGDRQSDGGAGAGYGMRSRDSPCAAMIVHCTRRRSETPHRAISGLRDFLR